MNAKQRRKARRVRAILGARIRALQVDINQRLKAFSTPRFVIKRVYPGTAFTGKELNASETPPR